MKQATLALLALTVIAFSAEPVTRTLTDTQGRKIEATLLETGAESVKFRRAADGQEFTLKLNLLSKADRDFIAAWQAGKLPQAADSASGGEAAWSWAIPAHYEAAGPFQGGLAPVKQGGKWGFINEGGKMVLSPRWMRLSEHRDGFLLQLEDGSTKSYGPQELYEMAGMNPPAPPSSATAAPETAYAHGLDYFREGDKYGVKKRKGEIIAPAEWSQRPEFSEEGAFLSNSRNLNINKGGEPSRFIDPTGKVLIEQPIGVEVRFQEGLAAAWKDLQHLGFIDRSGAFVIGPFKFTDNWRANRWSNTWNYRFSEGLAPFPDPKGGPLLGYLDKTGQMVIAPKWRQAGPFSEGLALVSEDQFPGGNTDKTVNWVIIDKTGAVLGTPEVPLARLPSGPNPSLGYPMIETGFKNGQLKVLGADDNR